MNVDGLKIDKSGTEKLLGVKFDKKLTFDYHISDICEKVGRKISALARVTIQGNCEETHTHERFFYFAV